MLGHSNVNNRSFSIVFGVFWDILYIWTRFNFIIIFSAHFKFPWEYTLLCFHGNMSVHGGDVTLYIMKSSLIMKMISILVLSGLFW